MFRTYQQFSRLPFGEKLVVIRNLTRFPALSVMVFLRDDLGFRILNLSHFLWIAFFLFVATLIFEPVDGSGHPEYLVWFGIAGCFAGLYQRSSRWIAHKRGHLQHSYYIGTSLFLFSWLPRFLRCRRRVERFVDPFFCLFMGAYMMPMSPLLGLWLVFCGLCLARFEGLIHQKELNQCLDVLDGLVESEVHTEQVETFEPPPVKEVKRKQQKIVALPTGIGADIAKQIKRRRR